MKQNKRLRSIARAVGVTPLKVTVTGKGHLKLHFDQGAVVMSRSPSCLFADKHVLGDIRRLFNL